MTVFGITDQGIVVPRVSDWLKFIREEVESEVNETIDWDGASKSIGMIVAIMAAGLGEVSQATQLAFSQNDRNAVRGVSVDNLGSYTLTPRLQPTRSTVVLTCTGTTGTNIPAGRQVRDTVTGEVWRSRADATISGSTLIEFEAVNVGSVSAAPGSVTDIRTAVAGWASATNVSSAIPGRDRELDVAYNLRQVTDLARDSANTALSIRANLLRIDNVQAVAIIENDQPEPQTVEGILLPKNSVNIFVYPSSIDETYRSAVATVVWRFATSGIYQNGAETAQVIDAAGASKTVRWDWVSALAVNVTIAAVVYPGVSTGDTEANLAVAVAAHFSALNVGEDVSRLDLLGIISDQNKQVNTIKSATLLINGNAVSDQEVTIVQRAIQGTITITATA